MEYKGLSLVIRIAVAFILTYLLWKFVYSGTAHGQQLSLADGLIGVIVAVPHGLVLFVLLGRPLLECVGERIGNALFVPSDKHFRIMPEYSLAEARVSEGKYQEAIDEYRKVIIAHPEDIYPHLRIAELALKHQNDLKLAELELLSALGKANGQDSTALAAGRLADFYQLALQDPTRALEVMKQLREKIPDTKQALLAEERIVMLESIVHNGVVPPRSPDKIANKPSRYKVSE
jgi:tetratricopeptide (TPR) repeat protein